MIDYYQLKEAVKENLLRLWQGVDVSSDPLVYAWITYAISIEGNNSFVTQALEQSRAWVESDEFWSNAGNLSSFNLFYYLGSQSGGNYFDVLIPKYVESLRDLISKGVSKFSKLNDPHFMFSIALGSKAVLPNDLIADLSKHCLSNVQIGGSIVRTLFFQAATIELHVPVSPVMLQVNDLQPYDLFTALWFSERYSKYLVDDRMRQEIWNAYDRLKEGINLDPLETESSLPYSSSPFDLVMLYEALAHQTKGVDPVILFRNIPLHPKVKQVSENLFIKGEYVNSVFEATKAFIEAVRIKAGHPKDPKKGKELDGFILMESSFIGKNPNLKFNLLSTPSEIDEQNGLRLLSEGVVSAFRNPKGHTPATGITLSSYEALEQLSIISYLMRRLDSSTK